VGGGGGLGAWGCVFGVLFFFKVLGGFGFFGVGITVLVYNLFHGNILVALANKMWGAALGWAGGGFLGVA
ncbi:hypothetical protein AAGG42_22940, partial [Stenotrophomonas maltophilia]|uniref:hypothetical protein n=1 Tax=Stenotrophomonas maltophilia TaxID=40324 RepID=UPI0031453EA2